MEDIKDSDYNHAKRVSKDFEIKRSITWFVFKSGTLLLVLFLKVLENCA